MLHYQKDLNVEASYDVVVAGCGASGVCAAVAQHPQSPGADRQGRQ